MSATPSTFSIDHSETVQVFLSQSDFFTFLTFLT